MKKFLKVFIIILSIVAVVAGTAFFFFRKLEEKNNKTGSIIELLQSEDKIKFDEDLIYVSDVLTNDSDSRLELVLKTSKKLDEITLDLSTYNIQNNTSINDKNISQKLKQVNSLRSSMSGMIVEFKIKDANSTIFNEKEGANDLFKQSCYYLTEYANLVKMLNINSNYDDLKFNMFELYANVVIDSFSVSNLIYDGADKTFNLDNKANIEKMNAILKIRNSRIVRISNEGLDNETVEILNSSDVNKFNRFYSQSDKALFAKELSSNLTYNNQSTVEKKAAYYLKLVFGI